MDLIIDVSNTLTTSLAILNALSLGIFSTLAGYADDTDVKKDKLQRRSVPGTSKDGKRW